MIRFKKRNIFVFTVILIILVTYFLLEMFDRRLAPTLQKYAENETKTIITYLINESVREYTTNHSIKENIEIVTNKNNEILYVDIDTLNINEILFDITSSIQSNFSRLEDRVLNLKSEYAVLPKNGEITYFIPSGLVGGNSILSNLGAKVPVSARVLGNVKTNVKTNVEDYGINTSLIKVFANIEVSALMLLPFTSKKVTISTDVLLGMKVVWGKVPEYYGNLSNQSLLVRDLENMVE